MLFESEEPSNEPKNKKRRNPSMKNVRELDFSRVITEDKVIFAGEKFRLKGKLEEDCQAYAVAKGKAFVEAGITF